MCERDFPNVPSGDGGEINKPRDRGQEGADEARSEGVWLAPGVTYRRRSRRPVVVPCALPPPVVVDARVPARRKIGHTLAGDEVAA
jgi:hypothetical protein